MEMVGCHAINDDLLCDAYVRYRTPMSHRGDVAMCCANLQIIWIMQSDDGTLFKSIDSHRNIKQNMFQCR